jgi:PII-like signaling protein
LALDDDPGRAVKLTVYGGRSVRAGGQTGYVAAVELLRRSGFSGASVLLAVDGTLHGERQRARFFARNANVPLMLLSVGGAEAVRTALPGMAELLTDAVATIERVQVCKLDGRLLSRPRPFPPRNESGMPVWQKVMVHTEEQAHIDGHALHRVLAHRLLAAGAAGVTVLRGVRGFYAGHAPFADRVLSVRRNVPVHVVVVDAPDEVQRWWPIVDGATREAGLVTSELVPALHGSRVPHAVAR